MVLMVSFKSRISPLTLTVIFFERSPLAIAVATSAMSRTWPVQVAGHGIDRIREIFPRARHTWNLRLSAESAVRPNFACHTSHFRCERA